MNGVLHDIFPKESISYQYQLADIHQTEYLINGEIRIGRVDAGGRFRFL